MFDNIVGNIVNNVVNTVDDFVDDPLGTTTKRVMQPIVDGCDLLDGLTEGEFRHRAALRLGTEAVAGMAISQVIEAMQD
jgi:hypothetical protein